MGIFRAWRRKGLEKEHLFLLYCLIQYFYCDYTITYSGTAATLQMENSAFKYFIGSVRFYGEDPTKEAEKIKARGI